MQQELTDKIKWVGVNDRRTDLFEGYWPLITGISYNAYLINDEKTVLIDGVKDKYAEDLIDQLPKNNSRLSLDYIVINHMEPDHTGSLPFVTRLAPEVTLVGTDKTKSMLQDFYGINKDVLTVETGDSIDLGTHTLKFVETPFVHWPETMMTYEKKEKILFSGDGFGSFGTLDGGIFDDELDTDNYIDETIRYFSNIVGAYSATTRAALAKLSNYQVETVAPAHGPVWRSQPEEIIELYDKLSNLRSDPGVTILYGSMYGYTERVMESVAAGARKVTNGEVKVIDASRTHPSFSLAEAWKRKGMIIGSPTYEARTFPPVDQFVDIAGKKKLKNKVAGIFGSFGWSGGAARELSEVTEKLNWELIKPPLEFNGRAAPEKLQEAYELGKSVAEAANE